MTFDFSFSLKNLKTIANNFFQELINAENGKDTSLAFIKYPMPKNLFPIKEKVYQEINIGGTIIKFQTIVNKKIVRKKAQKINYPLSNKKNLFEIIKKYVDNKTKFIILNFAFPLKPIWRKKLLDGKLIKTTKEHQLKDLVGKFVGEELERYLYQEKKIKTNIIVLNDVIFLLLKNIKESASLLSLIAGIVGTGTNFGFFLDKKTAINLESGNFDKFQQSPTGIIIDKNSKNPGKQLFEKEVAGAYLYKHYNLLTKKNVRSTKELSDLAKKGDFIAQNLIKRSAYLIACQLAGIYKFKKMKNPDLKLELIIEGSLFTKGWQYAKTVKNLLKML